MVGEFWTGLHMSDGNSKKEFVMVNLRLGPLDSQTFSGKDCNSRVCMRMAGGWVPGHWLHTRRTVLSR